MSVLMTGPFWKLGEFSMTGFDLAVISAATAHAGQVDRNGEPYILHPVRVASLMDTELERQVAVLHDVLEDTPWTARALRGVFDDEVVDVVVVLTRQDGEDYQDYLVRVSKDPIAQKVKLADLWDNLREGCPHPKKYTEAIAFLEGHDSRPRIHRALHPATLKWAAQEIELRLQKLWSDRSLVDRKAVLACVGDSAMDIPDEFRRIATSIERDKAGVDAGPESKA